MLYIRLLYVASLLTTGVTGLAQEPLCERQDWQAAYERVVHLINIEREEKAVQTADSLLEAMEEAKAETCQLRYWVLYEKSEVLEVENKFDQALDMYYHIAIVAQERQWYGLLAETYISMARSHEAIGRSADCLEYLQLAEQLIRTHDFPAVFSRYAVRLSSYHRLYASKDTARTFAALAVTYGEKYRVHRSVVDGHMLLAFLSESQDTAIYHLQAAVNSSLRVRNYNGAAWMTNNIARRYLKAKQFEKARELVDTTLLYVEKSGKEDYELLYYTYQLQKEVLEALGLMDSAYVCMEKLLEISEKGSFQVNQDKINEQEKRFAIAQQEAKLRYEQQQKRYLRWGLGLMLLLVVILSLAFWYNRRQTRLIQRQAKRILEQNTTLESSLQRQSMLLSEVHHRVKNNLQIIISLLTLEVQNSPSDHLRNAFTHLSNKVRSMALIHEQLYQLNAFESIRLKPYFQRLSQEFEGLHSEGGQIRFRLTIPEAVQLNLETLLPIAIICTELITNSLKYARKDEHELEIGVTIQQNPQGEYLLRYQDNGDGYPETFLHTEAQGLGKLLIQSMVRQLLGKHSFENTANGACFQMQFNEKEVAQV